MNKKPLIIAAPLAGYTNLGYRRFLKTFGVDLTVSEMISDFALIYHNKETINMVKTSFDERPVALQLFGGSKESLLKGLEVLQEVATYDYLDLNFGCPVNKVFKNNAGSAFLKNERRDELFETVKAIVNLSKVPVTAKIRLGINEDSINVIDTCKTLEKAGVSLITIHGRTKAQLYAGKANYDYIKLAKEACKVKIIANGDIDSLSKAIDVLNYTKADGIALGRGILGNPYLITQIKRYYEDGTILEDPSLKEQLEYLKRHYYLLKETKNIDRAIIEMRGIAPHYLKRFANIKKYKVKLSMIKNEEELMSIIDEILNDKSIKTII